MEVDDEGENDDGEDEDEDEDEDDGEGEGKDGDGDVEMDPAKEPKPQAAPVSYDEDFGLNVLEGRCSSRALRKLITASDKHLTEKENGMWNCLTY